jgi:NhaA family Na+:H+ antiporter
MNDKTRAPEPQLPEAPIDTLAAPLKRFLATETSGGVVLLVAVAIALVVANTPLGAPFEAFWETPVGLRLGDVVWEYDLRHWINDGLVTLFFFVIGLEIKREVAHGELSTLGAAALPILAAVGGMMVPAGIYLLFAAGEQAGSGWGVVMATDIAFVVGAMALLGRRVPNSLRVFVLALALVDDIGAILVIAVGYSHGFNAAAFAAAVAGLGVVALMRWLGVRPVLAYWAVGALVWLALHESGIHPTIAGVALGLMTPVTPWVDRTRFDRILAWAMSGGEDTAAHVPEAPARRPRAMRERLARAAMESLSPEERLERGLHPWSAFVVLPIFALANAGVPISLAAAGDPITLAVVLGLVVGKPVGIFAFSWIAVAAGLARKPAEVSWPMLFAAGCLAGIGFTMSLFIASLAFTGTALEAAKLGILAASLLAAALGMAMLALLSARQAPP